MHLSGRLEGRQKSRSSTGGGETDELVIKLGLCMENFSLVNIKRTGASYSVCTRDLDVKERRHGNKSELDMENSADISTAWCLIVPKNLNRRAVALQRRGGALDQPFRLQVEELE